jgi:hypothetical protein
LFLADALVQVGLVRVLEVVAHAGPFLQLLVRALQQRLLVRGEGGVRVPAESVRVCRKGHAPRARLCVRTCACVSVRVRRAPLVRGTARAPQARPPRRTFACSSASSCFIPAWHASDVVGAPRAGTGSRSSPSSCAAHDANSCSASARMGMGMRSQAAPIPDPRPPTAAWCHRQCARAMHPPCHSAVRAPCPASPPLRVRTHASSRCSTSSLHATRS